MTDQAKMQGLLGNLKIDLITAHKRIRACGHGDLVLNMETGPPQWKLRLTRQTQHDRNRLSNAQQQHSDLYT